MRKAVIYVAIRGDPSGRFYVYRYVVVSPTREEGCNVVCSGCGGDKAWYMAISKVLEEVRSKYAEVELRTHFSHIPKGLFRTKLEKGVEVKYIDERDNLALKGIDKCLAKKMAQPAATYQPSAAYSQPVSGDPHEWQYDFYDEVDEALSRGAPIIALSAPTGSGKTKAVLEASKNAVDRKLASLAVAAVRTKTQQEPFIRDNEQFGVGFTPVRLPSKDAACIQIRMAPRPPEDWDEEERKEYLNMLARRAKCSNCSLNSFTASIRLDALRRIVVEATVEKQSSNDELYVEELENKLREEIRVERGPAEAERGNVCAYSAVKNAAAYMVEKGEPMLVVGTYYHVLSSARVLLLNVCNPGKESEEGKENEEDSAEEGDEDEEEPGCPAVVVIDEAHNLWKSVIDLNRYSISDVRILKVAEDLETFCRDRPETNWCVKFDKMGGVGRILRDLADVLGKLAELNSNRKTRYGIKVKVLEPPDVLIETAERLSAVLEEVCKPYLDEAGNLVENDLRIARACALMRNSKRFLRALRGEEPRWGVYSIIYSRNRTLNRSFILLPVDLRGIVGRARELFYGPWVLLSGTINKKEVEDLVGRGVHFYRASVKFGMLSVRLAVSRDVNLLTTRYDVGRNEEMYRRYAVAVQQALKMSKGPLKLVVYPSYDVMYAVKRYYSSVLGGAEERWEKKKKKPNKSEIEKLLRKGKLVNLHAVAHGSFVEGIEFKLDDGRSAIGTVVVAGIPVPNIFNDYYVDVAKHFGYLDRKCAEELHRAPDFAAAPGECRAKMIEWGYTLSETALRQIVGRAIRGPQDSATLYFLDTRIVSVPRLRDVLCRGLHYHVECAEIPAEELISSI
jgi:Rad3-related DNA helicase